jgi:hypothetical protein
MTDRVSSGGPFRREPAGGRDAVMAAVLLVVALLPVFLNRGSLPGGAAASADARMQVAWETHTRRAIADGTLPLWNPYNGAGRLHLADARTQALYPPHVLLRFLPIGLFFLVSGVLHGWIFGLGAYAVARTLGAPRSAACAAAIGVMLLGIVVPLGAGHAPPLASIAWLPVLLALALQASTQSRLLPPPPLAIVAALAFTAGGRPAIYATAAITACYLLALAWPGERRVPARRTSLRLGVVLALAAGLSAFQLVPSLRMRTAAAWAGGMQAAEAVEAGPGPAEAGPHSAAAEAGPRSDAAEAGPSGVAAGDAGPGPAEAGPRSEAAEAGPRSVAAGEPTALLASLAAPAAPRTVSTCAAVDAGEMLRLGVPGLAAGSASTTDYETLIGFVAGRPGSPAGAIDVQQPATRRDLLRLLNAGIVVGCGESDGGDAAHVVRPLQITRVEPLPRAFWTCAPRRTGREELDYRLQNYRYDDTLSMYPANPVVNVRWVAGLDEAVRVQAETDLQMRPRRAVEDRTGQYDLLDASRTSLAAIVRHPLVEDTAGFDRGSLELPPAPPAPAFDERQSEWLLGVERCDELRPAAIERMDTADGRFAAVVDAPRDGVLFVGDAYHPDRVAWVDGARVDALRTNLALTAIPVTAGTHRVELRLDMTALWVGAGLTLLTLAAWIAAARMTLR